MMKKILIHFAWAFLLGCDAQESFHHPKETQLTKGSLLTTLPSLSKEYYLSFELLVSKHTSAEFRSLLHLTIDGNFGKYGSRIPGIWLFKDNTIHIASAINGDQNYLSYTREPLKAGKWYLLEIEQVLKERKYLYQVRLNGASVHTVENKSPKDFKNVKVYTADPWYDPLNGKIKNLMIANSRPQITTSSERGINHQEEINLTKNKLVTILPSLSLEFFISFQLLVSQHQLVDFRSVLHFTTGNNIGMYGDRIPGLWLKKDNALLIASAINGDPNYFRSTSKPIQVNKWYSVEIEQALKGEKLMFTFKVDGVTMHTVENKKAKEFKDVKIFAADPWYESTTGKIKNLKIVNGGRASSKGCKCGVVNQQNRIVGGQEAKINAYPWMAALATTEEQFYCGGTLVASEWVVTASHCLFQDRDQTVPTLPNQLKIVLGAQNRNRRNSKLPRKVVSVEKIFLHQNYDKRSFNNDIALVKLAESVDLSVYVPACMAEVDQDFTGDTARVYGWGTTGEASSASNKLLEVAVPVVTRTVCQQALSDIGVRITDGMLCAGGDKGKDACQGDSGGPLTINKNGRHTLAGSVSFGYGCGRANRYGVYAKTSAYRKWIDEILQRNSNPGTSECT